MTGSDDSHSGTRPISVAELLAKNGTIGAPPVGGRRRRRRGNADAVTVAELTGEIPVIRIDEPAPSPAIASVEEQPEEADTDAVPSAESAIDEQETADDEPETPGDEQEAPGEDVDDDYADAVAEYAAHVDHRRDEDGEDGEDGEDDEDDEDGEDTVVAAPTPRRFGFGRRSGRKSKDPTQDEDVADADAEHMSPDPLDDGETDVLEAAPDLAASTVIEDLDSEVTPEAEDTDALPSYLRSTQGPLFGGQSVADDLARRGGRPESEKVIRADVEELVVQDEDRDDEEGVEYGAPRQTSRLVHGLWIVGQSIFAVLLGAGLFFAFDQLWRWNNIIALVLSVLVILGLVVAVRVVRKTEDIASTLIAVAVGALVTLGPLALLQSG